MNRKGMIKNIMIVASIFVVTACGNSGSSNPNTNINGGAGPTNPDISPGTNDTNNQGSFISWIGNANDTYVLDATGDAFQFDYNSRLMHFGNTIITNVWVDASANLYFNDQIIGGIYSVKSTNGISIAGLVSNSRYFIDFYGPESRLLWRVSSKVPVFSSPPFNKSSINIETLGTTNKNTGLIYDEEAVPNAFIENRPLNSEGYATK